MIPWCVTIQMKDIEQHFHVVLFIVLYKVVLTLSHEDETLVCDHSNESYWEVHSFGTVYCAVQGGSNFKTVDETLMSDHSNETIEQYFHVVLFIVLYKVVLTLSHENDPSV